jgi:hypothetical protein
MLQPISMQPIKINFTYEYKKKQQKKVGEYEENNLSFN